jgi:hypothetical protein
LEQEFVKTSRFFLLSLELASYATPLLTTRVKASTCHAERRKTKKNEKDEATLAMLAVRDGFLEQRF